MRLGWCLNIEEKIKIMIFTDNLSCIVIGLEGIDKYLKNIELKKRVNNYLNNKNN